MDSKNTTRRDFIKSGTLTSGSLLVAPSLIASHPTVKPDLYSAPKGVVLFSGKANEHVMDMGLGFNWFEHLGSGGNYARWIKYPLTERIYPDLNDEAGWNAIEQGLDELNPGWIRFGLPPDPHVDSQGNFIENTVHLKHLEWLNRWAVKKNRVILLDLFLMSRYYEFPLPDGIEDPGHVIVNMAAENNREYARNFVAPMIEYVVNTLKLEAVKYFNPINEPMEYGVYQTPDNCPPAMAHYVEMYREIREALDAIKIDRRRMGLVGLDCGNPGKFTLEQHSLGIDIDPYVDAYSVHHYNLRLDYLPPISTPDCGRNYFLKGLNVIIEQEDKQFLNYTRLRDKPLWALEMGTFYYGKFATPEGVASLDATITVAEGVIRAINAGITSFCIWSLMNPNNVDGHWAVMGEKDGELVRHKYPFAVYGLMANHLPLNAIVYPLQETNPPEILHIHATALENPDHEKTIMVVNDHPERQIEVELTLPENWVKTGEFDQSLADQSHLNEPMSSVLIRDGKITITCPPFSLIGLKPVNG